MRNLIKKILKESKGGIDPNRVNNPQKLLYRVKDSDELKLKKIYLDVVGEELILPQIDIKIDDTIKDGKIAGFNHPKNGGKAEMGIKSKALDDIEYLKWVITHELIHAAVGKDLPKSKEHERLFKKLAEKISLPREYWD